jgi:acyl-CoA synthetase (AMP-forming)/AMP-acid ligase II
MDGTVVQVNSAAITIAGRNISPTEIEQVAAQADAMRHGGVVAVGSKSGAAQSRLLIAAEFVGRIMMWPAALSSNGPSRCAG